MAPMTAARSVDRRGLTMIEVTISILTLTVAAYILSSTIGASLSHTVAKREQANAVEAAMNTLETMRATTFLDLFPAFNANPDDEPLGPGTAPGTTFDVDGLDPVVEPGGAVRPIGTILLPDVDGQLREDTALPALGLPRDLNGDMIIDANDHAGDYLVMPTIVRVEWLGRLGPRRFEMATIFVDLQKESEQE